MSGERAGGGGWGVILIGLGRGLRVRRWVCCRMCLRKFFFHAWFVDWRRRAHFLYHEPLISQCNAHCVSTVTSSASSIRTPLNIGLLTLALGLFPAFVFWVSRQEKHQKVAIIPNSLWKNPSFTAICITVFFSWAVFATTQYFMTLYFQKVQGLSAIQTSMRFLPMVVSGAAMNVATGFLVNRVSANVLVVATVAITSVSPLVMALADPRSSYWYSGFVATLMAPICADTLFTISNLIITSVFPAKTQGLAGGVFNTLSQIGNSVGLAVGAIVASTVSASGGVEGEMVTEKLERGYRAAFWTCFVAQVLMLGVSGWGLRSVGKVGLKRD